MNGSRTPANNNQGNSPNDGAHQQNQGRASASVNNSQAPGSGRPSAGIHRRRMWYDPASAHPLAYDPFLGNPIIPYGGPVMAIMASDFIPGGCVCRFPLCWGFRPVYQHALGRVVWIPCIPQPPMVPPNTPAGSPQASPTKSKKGDDDDEKSGGGNKPGDIASS